MVLVAASLQQLLIVLVDEVEALLDARFLVGDSGKLSGLDHKKGSFQKVAGREGILEGQVVLNRLVETRHRFLSLCHLLLRLACGLHILKQLDRPIEQSSCVIEFIKLNKKVKSVLNCLFDPP